jgi:type IV pilus assembly protein PilY1
MLNIYQMHRKFPFAAWIIGFAMTACGLAQAATTDLASEPLASATSSVVKPNVLFTLDDSGSMAWNFLPDYAGVGTSGGVANWPSGATATHCKVSNTCGDGETPFQTNDYNGIAYDPSLTYQLPINADGTLKTSQGSPWTAVPIDGYGIQSTSNKNLVTSYPEMLYCNGGVCKKNGVDTNNPFLLRATVNSPTDNAPVYAFPGTLLAALTWSTLYDGTWNQPVTTSGTIFNGTLNISTAAIVTTLSGVTVTRSGSTSTVNVAYNALTPALVTGDTVVVSGSTCSSGYKSGGNSRSITVVNATHFSYTSNSGTSWTNTGCTVVATKAAVTASAPMISKSGNTVTVALASAPTPALATGSLVTVANGSGTCDAGYKATSVGMTYISNISFSYSVASAVGTATNTSCNITQVATTLPVSPGLSLSGTVVTVYKTAHGLSNGDKIRVSNGSCSNGYQTSAEVTVTVVDTNTFTYTPPVGSTTTNSNCKMEKATTTVATRYPASGSTGTSTNGSPYYFVIIPTEYCDSIYLNNCIAATASDGVTFTYPAPVRFCKNDATALLPPGDAGAQLSGSTVNCQAKYSSVSGHQFMSVRYGLFWRGQDSTGIRDIVPARTTYGNETFSGSIQGTGWTSPLVYSGTIAVDRSKRTDCAAPPNCTYTEEMTNFANWYAYYGTRMQMMKSAGGLAFSALDNRYRVGFVTINPSSSEYLAVAPFTSTQKTSWYSKFYAINPGNSTPLREGLANAGRYFAGKKPWSFATDDPMEYACQENFVLITTDGYWNGTDANVKEIDGTTQMRNYDNVDSGVSKRSDGAYDGGVSGATNTLADVAAYYYKTDIRNSSLSNCTGALSTDVCEDIVPMTSNDTAAGLQKTQHMSTFSLGLADGLLTYQSDYEKATSGDFYNITHGATGCSFSGSGVCNWPLPVADTQTALDDLWHAAVNGRGTYYNARDPRSLSNGLSSALTAITITTAAAAASATSSPNITQTDRSIFSSTYRTVKWDGEVKAQLLEPLTGNVLPYDATVAGNWSAQAQLDTLIQADTTSSISSRHIYTFDDSGSSTDNLKDFLYGSLTSTEQAYFDNKCSFTLLSQCSLATLSAAEITSGNSGLNLIHYLRGNHSLEPDIFRARDHFLGDTVNAKPNYVRLPQYSFTDAVSPSYAQFISAQTSRQGVLYMGANDGMLHAFNTTTGAEMWAYVPKIVMPNMYKLAEASYATLHQYYVDGSPETMDIYVDATTSAANSLTPATGGWHTILVGGLGFGGRGFYALDVTDPANPHGLWEICSDSSICTISDNDLGYSYGNPVITKRSTDGKWVVLVTSGYNNTGGSNPGKGILYVLDAVTGTVLTKTSTGSGSATTPSGLAKLSPWVDNPATDFTTRYVYGGDLNGDVWRFDLGAVGASGSPTATRIAILQDASNVAQSVTTRPQLGDPLNNTPTTLGAVGNPGIFVATGRYLGSTDLSNTQVQSVYGIKDDLSKTGSAANIGNPRAPNTGFGSFVKQYIYNISTGATQRSTSTYAVNWATNQGWYADFVVSNPTSTPPNQPVSPSPSPGERVNIDPLLISGTLIVATNVPASSACSIGGSSWLYSFDFLTGQYISSLSNTTHVVAQNTGSLVVGINFIRTLLGDGKTEITTADAKVTAVTPTIIAGAAKRSSWRELTQ